MKKKRWVMGLTMTAACAALATACGEDLHDGAGGSSSVTTTDTTATGSPTTTTTGTGSTGAGTCVLDQSAIDNCTLQ